MSIESKTDQTVDKIMLPLERCPVVASTAIIKEVLDIMDQQKLGVVFIVDNQGQLVGVLTEGDVRRLLLRVQKPLAALMTDDVSGYAVQTPVAIEAGLRVFEAMSLMTEKKIWDLPVIEKSGRMIGLLHMHQIVQAVMSKLD